MNLYERLLRLPLFQGLGSEEMSEIIGQTRFRFFSGSVGGTLFRQDGVCRELVILLQGSLSATRHAANHGYAISEFVKAPSLIEPFRLFGLRQHYTRTYVCEEACSLVALSKDDVASLLQRYLVFRLNWLNMLSTDDGRHADQLWHTAPATLRRRIAAFVAARCLRPAGEKIVTIKMTQLADELNDSRLDISRALHTLQDDGLLSLSRGRMLIPALERLSREA